MKLFLSFEVDEGFKPRMILSACKWNSEQFFIISLGLNIDIS
jgi:hypothetical protein